MLMYGILCQHRSGHTAYQQFLSYNLNREIYPELDINIKDIDEYFKNLPKKIIFAMMPFKESYYYMKKYSNINWQIYCRKDVLTQCLSFIYTNKTQNFRDNQNKIVEVDEKLIDSFFNNWKIINEIIIKNEYPVYYYQDFDMSNTPTKKNQNNYKKLIKNIDSVEHKILNILKKN
jgi:hypothetical protein